MLFVQGAAYGIAGIIKGLGILSLKQLDVMGKLTEAIQEKKNFKYREGKIYSFRYRYIVSTYTTQISLLTVFKVLFCLQIALNAAILSHLIFKLISCMHNLNML